MRVTSKKARPTAPKFPTWDPMARGRAIGQSMKGTPTKPQGTPGTPGTPGSPAEFTPNQSLATGLTADQQREFFNATQGAQGRLQEADFQDKDAAAQHELAMAELNKASARQAQAATDDLIARGMLQSGTAAGALGDIEVAAHGQREALNQALLSTTLRNQAVRTNILTQELPNIAALAQRTMGENIANGTVPGSFQTKPATAATPGQPAARTARKAAPKYPTWDPMARGRNIGRNVRSGR